MIKIAFYQMNSILGALTTNADALIKSIHDAIDDNCDLFLCPELALTGYPPEDLLWRGGFMEDIEHEITRFFDKSLCGITIALSTPIYENDKIYNSVLIIRDGEIIHRYDKQELPQYGVFDDKRYFSVSTSYNNSVFICGGIKVSVMICEDIWVSHHTKTAQNNGAKIICVVNASPFEINKQKLRLENARKRVVETSIPILYINAIGGQDEIVYDGASFMMDENGNLIYQAPSFVEHIGYINYTPIKNKTQSQIKSIYHIHPYPDRLSGIYNAILLGTHDYIHKNGFSRVVIGLSGGIDSALTLVIAKDAFGADNVTTVMMPTIYTNDISLEDSRELTKNLNITNHHEIDIMPHFNLYLDSLSSILDIDNDNQSQTPCTTKENLQARIRGTILMAFANKMNAIALVTSNKSEVAVGYSTLYGDMAGGFAPLKDIPKTTVYELAKWYNNIYKNKYGKICIPERIITRPPSAELRNNQMDVESLPDYETLDDIIHALVVDDKSTAEIIFMGYNTDDVLKIAKLLKQNEYKRQQSAIGVKITTRAFGKDWRYSVTNGYNY